MFAKLSQIPERDIIFISGIPEVLNENLFDTVHQVLSNKLKLSDVSKDNIQICHRLGSSQQKTRPILVRFMSTHHRQTVWEAKTALKGSGVTLSEFLTQTRHGVFLDARRHFGLKSCWTVQGKILVITSDSSRHKIETREELQELITKFPSTGNSSTDKRVVQAPRSSQRNIAPEPSNNPKAAKRTRSKVRK
ncbi:hypothetical protein ACJJTC_001630 [Scirpophaga incertulas]